MANYIFLIVAQGCGDAESSWFEPQNPYKGGNIEVGAFGWDKMKWPWSVLVNGRPPVNLTRRAASHSRRKQCHILKRAPSLRLFWPVLEPSSQVTVRSLAYI